MSGRKGQYGGKTQQQMVDVVLFPSSSLDKSRQMESTSQSNMISAASNASNSAFKQAYESATAGKRDYISLVQNGGLNVPGAGDSHHHYSDTEDRYSDH